MLDCADQPEQQRRKVETGLQALAAKQMKRQGNHACCSMMLARGRNGVCRTRNDDIHGHTATPHTRTHAAIYGTQAAQLLR